MKKAFWGFGAFLILSVSMFLNFNQYTSINKTDIELTKLLEMNSANAETWINCINCKARGYYCNGNWQYKCVLGGTICNVSGQLPC
jgi:hypothetical protein